MQTLHLTARLPAPAAACLPQLSPYIHLDFDTMKQGTNIQLSNHLYQDFLKLELLISNFIKLT